MGRRKAGRRVKKRTQKDTDTADNTSDLPPRAFVFTKGKVPAQLKQLVQDLKRVMSPNTASSLRAQKRNKLRDFVDVAGTLHVSFFLIVSATPTSAYLRVVRTPRGPTLTFRIDSYSLASDIAASTKKPYSPGEAIWKSAPTLILSNFDRTVQQEALSATMMQNLFPTLNVATARLATFRRVVLLHQLPESEGGCAQLRQYVIKAAPTGVSRGVKKLVRATRLPSLGRYESISDFLTGAGGMSSDSGGETDEEDKADLPQDYVGRNAKKAQKVSIKLREIGPRLSLRLLKVEEGLCDGATLYHALVQKSESEVAQTAAKIEARKALKAERKATQAANVARKKEAAAEALAGRKRRRMSGSDAAADADADDDDDDDDDDDGGRSATLRSAGLSDDDDYEEVDDMDGDFAYGDGGGGAPAGDEYDDDAAWYKAEVGEDAPAELGLLSAEQKRKKHAGRPPPEKKPKAAAMPTEGQTHQEALKASGAAKKKASAKRFGAGSAAVPAKKKPPKKKAKSE